MRVAVFENLPPGGALRACYEIGRRLAARGHELHLFRLSAPAEKAELDLAPYAASVHVVPFRPALGVLDSRLRRMKTAPRSYTVFGPLKRAHRRLAAEMRAGGYDVAFLHQDAFAQGPYAMRWLTPLPAVYYCQEPPRFATERAILEQHRANLASSPFPVSWGRLVEDRFVLDRLAHEDYETVQHATRILVNSVFSRERVYAAYARDATVCYLGIDAERFAPPAQRTRRREVLSIGLPVAAKGHELVVRALALLPHERRPGLRLILPRHEGTQHLEGLARDLGVDVVVDVGVTEEMFVDRYREAMATVCAARLEPFGLTPVESMGCGTPVVAIREGGYRETVVDGETGLLVEPDAADLAAAIGRLVDDQQLAERMGRSGRARVEKEWTWARTGEQVEEVLEEVRRHGG